MLRVLSLALVLAFCSSANAAAILTTQDDYKAPVLPIVETFDDGKVNAPGLTANGSFQFVAGGIGGGQAIEAAKVFQTLDQLTNYTVFSFVFDQPWPTQVGFVTTQADFPAETVGMAVLPDTSANLLAPFAPNRFFQVTDPNGIQYISIAMQTSVPGQPFFQVDDLQYVPEPSGAVLLAIGVSGLLILGCRGHADFRWLRACLATLAMLLVIRQAVAITTSDDPANHVVKAGTGRDGIVHIAAANGNFGTGTLLASGRHVWTASHVLEVPTVATTANVNFDLTGGTKKTIGGTIAFQSTNTQHDFVILRLAEPAPLGVETYEPYRQTDEKNRICEIVGYGQGGKGDVGATPGIPNPWIKRSGSNRVDRYDPNLQMEMDFDSGKAEHNTILPGELGLESAEACIAQYDSGGPLLLSGKLAGWARTVSPSDSKWGAISSHRRVSLFLSTYDQYVPPVVKSVVMSRQSGPASYAVPTGSGEQLRTVPVGGTNRITVTFSEEVQQSVFVMLDGITSTYVTNNSWVFPFGRVLRIDIPGPIQRNNMPGDKLKLTLQNIKKLGATGAALDGDWVNPDDLGDTTQDDYGKAITRYPSGDGNPGTSFEFWITVLPADYDGNNIVDLTDFGTHKANVGKANPTYAEGDGDGDGDIDLDDFGALKANFGTDWTSF